METFIHPHPKSGTHTPIKKSLHGILSRFHHYLKTALLIPLDKRPHLHIFPILNHIEKLKEQKQTEVQESRRPPPPLKKKPPKNKPPCLPVENLFRVSLEHANRVFAYNRNPKDREDLYGILS